MKYLGVDIYRSYFEDNHQVKIVYYIEAPDADILGRYKELTGTLLGGRMLLTRAHEDFAAKGLPALEIMMEVEAGYYSKLSRMYRSYL